MIFNLKISIFFLIFFLTIVVNARAQKVGTTSFQFLKVMTDARATSMGEAYSSVVNTSEAVFWNPAALTKIRHFDIAVSYLDWLLDVTHSSFAASYNLRDVGSIGFQLLLTNVGEIEVTRADDLGFVGDTYNPGLTGEKLSPGAMVLGVSFARQLTDKFAFGLTTKVVREDLGVRSKATLAFDGGITFRTGFRSLQLAAVIRHFGPEIKYVDKSYPLPQTFTIGVSGYLISPESFFLFPSHDNSLLFAYDLSQPRDYDQQHHLGLEYSFKNLIFLRGGYKLNFDEEGLALGFGLKMSHFRFDYSYDSFGEFFDSVHRFTLGFTLE